MVIIAGAVVLYLVGMMFWLLLGSPVNHNDHSSGKPASSQITSDMEMNLGNNLVITALTKYAGIYLEDGSDTPVSDVLTAVLENRSKEALQYADIIVTYSDGTQANFTVTNLPAGGKIALQEINRRPYRNDVPSAAVSRNTVFMPEFTMYRETFKVSGLPGMLNVKNISDKDVEGDIYVYYKNSTADLLYGGITYRAKVRAGLKAGEIRQINAGHFNPESSVIVMITCGE
jgi:hypothetical protein